MVIKSGTFQNIGNSYEVGSNSALLTAIARSAEELTSGKGWPDGVNDLLEALGRVTGVSRVWIFQTIEVTDTHITQNYTFEWASAEHYVQIGMPMFSMFTSAINQPEYRDLVHSRMRGEWQKVLTSELEPGWLHDNQTIQDIDSMLTIPVMVEGEWWGTLGFDDCERAYDWSDVEISLLRTAGYLISNAVLRDRLSAKRKQFNIFKKLTDSSVWEFDFKTGQIWCSPEVLYSVPMPTDNIRFSLHDALRLIAPADRRGLIPAIKEYLKSPHERVFRHDMRIFTDCGDLRWVELVGNLNRTDDGRPQQLAGILVDISQRKRKEKRLQEEAITDPLTGIANRRMFEFKLQEYIDDAVKTGSTFSVIFFDLDFLKSLNDTYGHMVGDRGLCHVAEVCGDVLRRPDIFARLGGDEFGLILPDTTEDVALRIGERLRDKVENTLFEVDGLEHKITISLGLVTSSSELTTPAKLINHADIALYEAKRSGRNKLIVYSQNISCSQA
ncbi:MAG: diguanylate cyclase [Desulfovibrio sp.]